MSWETQGRQRHGYFGHGTGPGRHAPPKPDPAATVRRNVAELTTVIYNEAKGAGDAAMTAVGWTVRNRMQRNKVDQVDKVWRGYAHGTPSSRGQEQMQYAQARRIATGILAGTISDPTHGATNFYSPKDMPKEGGDTSKTDVSGGLEDVPGVFDKKGQHVKNYRPGWSIDYDHFHQVKIPGVADYVFKFYQNLGGGSHVR